MVGPARSLPSVSVQDGYRGSRAAAAIQYTVRSPLQFWRLECAGLGAVEVLGLPNPLVEMMCIARVHALKREGRALVVSCVQQQ